MIRPNSEYKVLPWQCSALRRPTLPLVCLGLILSVAIARRAAADSYGPWQDQRVADCNGRYYVVLTQPAFTRGGKDLVMNGGGQVDYVLAEAGQHTAPVKNAVCELRPASVTINGLERHDLSERHPNPDVAVRKGDAVRGQGRLERPPRSVVVSSTGLGFAAIDVFGHNGDPAVRWDDILKDITAQRAAKHWTDSEFQWRRNFERQQYEQFSRDQAIVFVALDGKVQFRKTPFDLFTPKEIALFPRTVSSIWWSGGGWIDDRRKHLVVIGVTDGLDVQLGGGLAGNGARNVPLIRAVDIATGKVAEGFPDAVIHALVDGSQDALAQALDWTVASRLKEAFPHLARIFENRAQPVSIRLKAAAALRVLGDSRGLVFLKEIAESTSADYTPYRAYANRYLKGQTDKGK